MEGVDSTRVCPNSGDRSGNGGIYKSRSLAVFHCVLIQFIRSIYLYHLYCKTFLFFRLLSNFLEFSLLVPKFS